jgi:CRP-like cAMP-binding protein
MNPKDYISKPGMDRFIKRIPAGQYLFYQGQIATSMIVIVQGQIQLIGEKSEQRHVESVLEAGSFLGEKIVLGGKPYQRAYSARAESDTLYLEFNSQDLEQLEKTSPEILTDLLKRVVAGVAERFDRANYLIRALRSSNNFERLIHCILYFSRSSGHKFAGGVQVILSEESLFFYLDMDREEIKRALTTLVQEKLLVKEDVDHYLIPSEHALLAYLPQFAAKKAA